MTLRHLKVFVTVCECGTMRKASEILHIAQPAISNTIAELEKNYGVALFDRINQRVVITDSGKKLLIKAKAVLTAFTDFENTAQNNAESPIVNIGATLTIGKKMIPTLIKSLKESFSQISPHVTIFKASQIEELLLSGELDFALIEGEPLSDGINRIRIAKDRLAVVCGNEYVIDKKVSFEELVEHPLLIRESGSASRGLLDQVMQEKKLDYTAIMISQSNEALLEAAKENLGIAVLPQSLVKDELMSNAVKEIEIENIVFERNYYLVRYGHKSMSNACRKVFEFCELYCEKYFG